MTTLQITLDDDVIERLRREAAAARVSIETLVATAAVARANRAGGTSVEFEAVAAELVATYKPLLDRLA